MILIYFHKIQLIHQISAARCVQQILSQTSISAISFRLQSSFDGRNLLIQWQNVWFGAHWRDLELVDLSVALCVMLLDVSKFSGVLESIVLPIAVSDPSVICQFLLFQVDFESRTYGVLGIHCVYRGYYT